MRGRFHRRRISAVIEEMAALVAQNLRSREELWDGARDPQNLDEFDRMLALAAKAIEFLRDGASWQLEAVQAGRDGDEAKRVWISLAELIKIPLGRKSRSATLWSWHMGRKLTTSDRRMSYCLSLTRSFGTSKLENRLAC